MFIWSVSQLKLKKSSWEKKNFHLFLTLSVGVKESVCCRVMTSVTIIKQFSSTPAYFWSLCSWKRDLPLRNRDLNVGAAGRAWYRSCLSRRREICKQGVAHNSSCRCQPVPATAGIRRANRMISQLRNLPLYLKIKKAHTHHDTVVWLQHDIIQIKSCWTIKNHRRSSAWAAQTQSAFRWDKSNTFRTGNGKNMVILLKTNMSFFIQPHSHLKWLVSVK